MSREPKTAWWAQCDDCGCTTVVAKHPDEQGYTPEPEEWDNSGSCPVCGSFIANMWNEDSAKDVRLA